MLRTESELGWRGAVDGVHQLWAFFTFEKCRGTLGRQIQSIPGTNAPMCPPYARTPKGKCPAYPPGAQNDV